MNSKNAKKSLNHENAYANIPCTFRDGDISRLGVAYLTHAIRDTYIATSIIVRLENVAECFPQKQSWCRNEQGCLNEQCKALRAVQWTGHCAI